MNLEERRDRQGMDNTSSIQVPKLVTGMRKRHRTKSGRLEVKWQKVGDKPRKDQLIEWADGTQLTSGTPCKSLVQNMFEIWETPTIFQQSQPSTPQGSLLGTWSWFSGMLLYKIDSKHVCILLETWLWYCRVTWVKLVPFFQIVYSKPGWYEIQKKNVITWPWESCM